VKEVAEKEVQVDFVTVAGKRQRPGRTLLLHGLEQFGDGGRPEAALILHSAE
jgi:hypothetical protein